MHFIIDTEENITAIAAPAEEGEAAHSHPTPFSGSGQADALKRCVAATILELLQEELLPRLFPGLVPQLPPSRSGGASDATTAATTIMVQLQQSIIMRRDDVNESAGVVRAAFQTPPSVIGASPAALYCQPPLLPTAPLPESAARLVSSSGVWITVWLQLSAPLPSEGVMLLARHRGGFLEAQLERTDDNDGAPIIKVRVLQIKGLCMRVPTRKVSWVSNKQTWIKRCNGQQIVASIPLPIHPWVASAYLKCIPHSLRHPCSFRLAPAAQSAWFTSS